jgi:cysteine desulfurase/selenocysteine lyase
MRRRRKRIKSRVGDMGIDIDLVRRDTPGTKAVAHLIASGSGLMPQPVIDAVVDHTLLEAEIGGYEAQEARSEQLSSVYDSIASLIGAERSEIALVENATVAWCQAFYALRFKPGDRVLTCEAEYAANYVAFLQRAKRDGIVIDVVPSSPTGEVDLMALESMIDDDVALIAMTWIPTNGGLVNPAAEIGRIARRHGVPFLLDACQAVGQIPIDVAALGCDFLSATARKFLRGPRGIGFLYIAQRHIENLEPAMIDHFAAPWVETDKYTLRDDARRFETWENSYALRAGLGAAANYAMSIGLVAIQDRVRALADQAREQLADIKGAQLRDIGTEKCAIVSFTIAGLDPKDAVQKLRTQKINIGASDPSSTRLDAEARKLPTILRVAPHYYNTSEEIDRMVSALRQLL